MALNPQVPRLEDVFAAVCGLRLRLDISPSKKPARSFRELEEQKIDGQSRRRV